jgi:hypothetical protein
MVRLVRQDLVASVELFEQNDAGQEVRERRRAEGEPVVRAFELGAERAADHEADIAPGLAAILEPAREGLGRIRAAAAIEQANPRAFGDPALERLVVGDLDYVDAGVTREELRVVLEIVEERRTCLADGDHEVTHGVGC